MHEQLSQGNHQRKYWTSLSLAQLHFFLKQSNGVGSVVVVLQQDTEMVCSKIDLHNLCILIATAFEFCLSQFSSHV